MSATLAYVVPRPRVDDVLRLMQLPVETEVDAQLGREVALRDGAIRALITGSVEQAGDAYIVTAEVLSPADGQTVASHAVEAADYSGVMPSVRQLSGLVRETLGEALTNIQRSHQQLEKVTTPSLRALQLYSQAVKAVGRSGWPAAEQLARQAIEEDPDFAAAYNWIGYANQGQSREIKLPYFKRAADLAHTTSDRERYFLVASYHHQVGDRDKAIAAYEALSSSIPIISGARTTWLWCTGQAAGCKRLHTCACARQTSDRTMIKEGAPVDADEPLAGLTQIIVILNCFEELQTRVGRFTPDAYASLLSITKQSDIRYGVV